ncbi:unknown protein [Desulfotalea psychrophila LSv54]|uniref:Uncharacterized protein n=2 Tax=Desulfotalea psychrophila TaxID=84980 RepID=Q6ALL5_DESPS|nr:unknown protein [Desulfotalea psychrophila LSv54]
MFRRNSMPNIFTFATSELSTSAFYAWLLENLNPKYTSTPAIKQAALDFTNHCLTKVSIPTLAVADIKALEVATEYPLNPNCRIDIYAKFTRYGEDPIHLFIENKVQANETKKDQLVQYHDEIKNKETKGHITGDIAEIYLKSGYDFADPLCYKDIKGIVVSKGAFKKINWQDLWAIFSPHRAIGSDFVRDMAACVENKYNFIDNQRSATTLADFTLSDHVGQSFLLQIIFHSYFTTNAPLYTSTANSRTRTHYNNKCYLQVGNSRGRSWTKFVPCQGQDILKCRIEKLAGGYFLRLGIYIPKADLPTKLTYIKTQRDKMHDEIDVAGLSFIEKLLPRRGNPSAIFFAQIYLDSKTNTPSMADLQKLNSVVQNYISMKP